MRGFCARLLLFLLKWMMGWAKARHSIVLRKRRMIEICILAVLCFYFSDPFCWVCPKALVLWWAALCVGRCGLV